MLLFPVKQLVLRINKGKKLAVFKNSILIHKSFNGYKFILNRGMYGRYIKVCKENIGLTFGSFVSTRKFLNKPVYKKKR